MFCRAIFTLVLTASLCLLTSSSFADIANASQDDSNSAPTVIDVPPGPCDAITAAVDSLPPQGGTVQLKAGLYTCTRPIIVKKNHITLVGAGSRETMIRAKAGYALPVVVIGEDKDLHIEKKGIPYLNRTVHDITIGGFSIDGNYPGFRRLGGDPGKHECYDPRTDRSLFCGKDMGFYIRNNCLTIRSAQHVRANDIYAYHAFSGGIVLEKRNDDIEITNFRASGNWFDGFAGYETTNSRFLHFSVMHNVFSGISVDADFEGNIFDDGESSFNGDDGIFSHSVSHNHYRNLRITGNKHVGFFLDGEYDSDYRPVRFVPNKCNDTILEDSVIESVGVSMIANHLCRNVQLTNVQFYQPAKKCLLLHKYASLTASHSTCASSMENSDDQLSIDSQENPELEGVWPPQTRLITQTIKRTSRSRKGSATRTPAHRSSRKENAPSRHRGPSTAHRRR